MTGSITISPTAAFMKAAGTRIVVRPGTLRGRPVVLRIDVEVDLDEHCTLRALRQHERLLDRVDREVVVLDEGTALDRHAVGVPSDAWGGVEGHTRAVDRHAVEGQPDRIGPRRVAPQERAVGETPRRDTRLVARRPDERAAVEVHVVEDAVQHRREVLGLRGGDDSAGGGRLRRDLDGGPITRTDGLGGADLNVVVGEASIEALLRNAGGCGRKSDENQGER